LAYSASVNERANAVKFKSFLPLLAVLTLLIFSMVSTCVGTVVTFDDLSETASGSFIASPYHGFVWNDFFALNGVLNPAVFTGYPTNGYYYGTVSASNVAVAGFGSPGEIDSSATNFNFLSAYLTGAWNSNLNIEVQGFNGTNLLYDTTVVASATNPTLFTFDYQNINRLLFNSSGGQPAFGTDPDPLLVMDNFTYELVPEPSPLLLTAAAALLLWPSLKRKRTT